MVFHAAAAGSRRAFLALAAAGSCCWADNPAGRGDVQLSEARRYLDPSTEFPVIRLTNPEFASYLTSPNNRGIGAHQFLLFASDRAGKLDVYRLELRTGQFRRLTDVAALNPGSIALLPDERRFCYIDGPALRVCNMSTMRERELYRASPPFESLVEVSVAAAATHAYVVERSPGRDRVRAIPLVHGIIDDLGDSEDPIGDVVPRPGGGIAYRRGDSIRFRTTRSAEQVLALAPGRTGTQYWSANGASLLYLNIPAAPGERNTLREYVLKTGQDKAVAKTSQFVQFAPNADASVFAGASGSLASPFILILVRSVRREMTLCEHGVRDARNLAIAFTPNSQRILFQSDRHGKPAIYSIAVERFVAETES